MNTSRPNSPSTGVHLPNDHKQVTDVYNMIISENYIVKQNYNDLLKKYNELLCEYKSLYSTINDNTDNVSSGMINYLQNKNAELVGNVTEKAAPITHPYPSTHPAPHPQPKPHPYPPPTPPTPPTPPVTKATLPRPPPPHPPIPPHHKVNVAPIPVIHPKDFDMVENKDFEVEDKGRGHFGRYGHRPGYGRFGHYPHLPPYPYPYPYPYPPYY